MTAAERHVEGIIPRTWTLVRLMVHEVVRWLHRSFRKIAIYRWLDDLIFTVQHFHHVFGYYPNLFYPTTFNEHVSHKKLFDRNPQLTLLADKLEVRDYVRERIGEEYLTRLYQVTSTPDEIDFAALPDQFVVKTTHGSGWNVIIVDKLLVDRQAICQQLANWLSQSFYEFGREWCYKDIKPRLIVEEFLDDNSGNSPPDFKFFCFDGNPRLIQLDVDRFTDHKRMMYDNSWCPLEFAFQYDRPAYFPDRPHRLDEMLSIAGRLSTGHDFVRVDLYLVNDRIYFGEMTHYPENGFGKFAPSEYDKIIGSYWPTR